MAYVLFTEDVVNGTIQVANMDSYPFFNKGMCRNPLAKSSTTNLHRYWNPKAVILQNMRVVDTTHMANTLI